MDEEEIKIETYIEVFITDDSGHIQKIYRKDDIVSFILDARSITLAEQFHKAMVKIERSKNAYLVDRFKLATIYGYRLLIDGMFTKVENFEIRDVTTTTLIKKVKFDHK